MKDELVAELEQIREKIDNLYNLLNVIDDEEELKEIKKILDKLRRVLNGKILQEL